MTFEEILDQAIVMLQRRGRLTYSTLKRQFQLDDAALDDLKNELIEGQRLAVDERGNVLVWTGDTVPVADPAAAPALVQAPAPLTYTPLHLAEKIRTARAALEGERKQVTVLFADLKGSLELLADRDPEEARQLLDPVLERMMAAVHRYEGTVNQVMGDGIMALFGAPIAHEDHALRACYAAIAMQRAVGRYAEEVRRQQGLDVLMRVGLNSGEVVVRAIGNDLHMDYTAVGQTTHLAARMEQLARPGTTFITADTLRLVEGLVRVTALGPIPVKGLPEPVEVYELVGASTLRGRFQAGVMRGLTRFVGRDQELAIVQHALAQAGAGHGQVVALVGEAGVGKSRLVYELVHSHRAQGWLVLESASVSYGKATPYFPVIDLLKRYARIEERDDPRTLRAKVTGHVLTLDEALQNTIPALLALLDALPEDSPFLKLDPPQRRQRTLDALKRVLLRESQVQPLLLVFEDLHWIDTETQALLNSLVESLPTVRLLLLVNYRPEYQHGWGSKTYYLQLRLDPLPPVSAEAFLQALLGDDLSLTPLKRLLIARTQGNPFFLEETVRTLVETGVLVGERGAYRLAQPVESLQVPATVQAILAARIDRLPPEDKRLLQTAAVIGTEVPWTLLQAIADAPEEGLHRGLGQLQAAEFLYETSLFPEHAYTFKHALTHEVAYGSVLQERRRVLHTRIVEAIEELYADRLTEQAERLAYHALRGEVWDKALMYCQQAGAKAFTRSAYREAVVYFEQALTAIGHLPERRETLEQAIDLQLDICNALIPLGEFGAILDHLREAEAIATALDDQRRLGWVSAYMSNAFISTRDQDRAVEFGQRALAIATASGDFALEMMATFTLGIYYHILVNYRQAVHYHRKNVEALVGEWLYERFGQGVLLSVGSRSWLVQSLAELGDFAEGNVRGAEAVRIAETVEQPFTLSNAYIGVGVLHLRQGDLPQAIARLVKGLEICQTADVPLQLQWAAGALGYAYTLSGRLAEAQPLLERAIELTAARPVGPYPLWAAHLGEAYLLADRLEEAHQLAERALARARDCKQQGYEAWALRLLGEIAVRRNPPQVESAAAAYQQAMALAEELGMRPLQAHCHLGLGTLDTKAGQWEPARAELSAAIVLYRAMDMTFWLPQAEAALAQVEGQ
jgi:class 3 adenylate cyclase/tetratricopeptide (TPR) repeat protein